MKNWIKVERAKRNMTQEDLAKALGVSRHAIAAIESGRYEANVGFAIDVSRYFKLTVEQLFFRTDRDIPPHETQPDVVPDKK